MKPVFRNEEKEDKNVTTISRVEVDKEDRNYTTNLITREQADDMVTKAVEMATERVLKRQKNEDEDKGSTISSKTVKELQNIAGVFNALKDFSANPLQKKIEEKVGDMAATVVERSFGVPHSEQKKDLMDVILNSQFAYGLGSGMGQRAPELVQTFGKDKVEGWISGTIKEGAGGTGGSGMGIGGLSGIPGAPLPGMGMGMPMPSGVGGQIKEMEMILGLDPNNPEHVAAYAHSQGDMSVKTARRVLMIHQDDFIEQLESKGVDATQYRLRRNQGMDHQGMDHQGMGQSQENVGNVQEYRPGPLPRINDDLIINTPITEDNKWEDEKENVENIETQNVELHPEMERIEKTVEPNPGNIGNINNTEIGNYLKNLNDSIAGLKDMVGRQQQELDILKRDRMSPESPDDVKEKNDNTTTVRSMKTITNSNMLSKKGSKENIKEDVKEDVKEDTMEER